MFCWCWLMMIERRNLDNGEQQCELFVDRRGDLHKTLSLGKYPANVLLIFLLSYDMIWLVCYAIIQLYTIAIITWLDPPQPPQPFHLFFDLPMPWIGMMMMMVRISVVCGAFTQGGFTYRYILRISVIIIIMLRLMIVMIVIITIEYGNLDDGKIMVMVLMILMILTMMRMQDVRMIRTSLEGSGRWYDSVFAQVIQSHPTL